jgi:hypothetical protein
VDKTETVALMAATLWAGMPRGQETAKPDVLYGRVAALAWGLYDAVEMESVRRHSKQ